MSSVTGLGERLRAARRAQHLTLRAVATDTGLTVSYLSQIETGAVTPSLSALALIIASLDTDITAVFPEDPVKAPRLVRAGDPDRFRIAPNAREEYELLAGRGHDGGNLTALIARHFPGAPIVRFRHAGEEYALVLEGRIRVDIQEEQHVVGPGEWIHYSSQSSHGGEVVSSTPARVLWLLEPALL